MKSKQKRFGHAKILCLVLSLLLMVSMIPLGTTFASAEDGEEASSEVTLAEESVEPVESTEPEESEPDGVPEESGEPENTTYANSISGVLWIDANEDGTYDAGEQPLADYPVYLYAENDQDNAVDTATTDADGKYEFINISPGRYVVGIKAEENGTGYLLPLMGVQNDNKFYFAPDWSKVISNPIDIAADTVVEDIDAAMRTMPQIQPMAGVSWGAPDTWTTAATISTAGYYMAQSTLDNGKVFLTGGWSSSNATGGWLIYTSQLYDPDTNTWSAAATNNSATGRAQHAQSALKGGRVLVTGGSSNLLVTNVLNTAYIYNPNTNTWSTAANMLVAQYWHGQSMLNDGRVLITGGGVGTSGTSQRTAYIYDPDTNAWTQVANMPGTKINHGQSTLPDGRVLVTGGGSVATYIYDPDANTWSTVASSPISNGVRQSILLDGRVLITGANNSAAAYIYNPDTDTWSTAASLPANLTGHCQASLNDGRVFVVRGTGTTTTYIYTPEYFKVNLSATPTTTKVYSGGVSITATAENLYGTAAVVNDMEWLRVPVSDTTAYTASTFDTAYAAATTADKGTLTGTVASATDTTFTHNVTSNAVYWYKATLTIEGNTYSLVKSIKIDNIYTPVQVLHQGLKDGTISDYLYTGMLANTTGGSSTYGIPYDLGGTTVLTSPSLGYDEIALVGGYTGVLWTLKTPSQEKNVTLNGTPAALGLGTPYTFDYKLDPSAITVQFDSQGGTPSTIANQYYMSTDTFGTLPSVARTGYNFDGWFTAATGGSQVNATDTAGSHFSSGSTATLYAQWTASTKNLTISNEVTGAYANMEKVSTFTVTLLESDGVTPLTGTFTYMGGVIAGSNATAPANGTLTLGSGGEATVTLTTGQTITIAGVATSAKVRVVQTTDTNYTTSFKDSLDASSTTGADTGVRSMTVADRTFDFTNTRSMVPGGISTGSGSIVLLSLMALALASGFAITAAYLRRRAGAR